MNTFETMKKFMNDGGKCLLIENSEPIGVVLTMEEYEKLNSESRIMNHESQTNFETEKTNPEIEKTLFSETGDKPVEPISSNPIGEAMAREMDYPAASADINEIEAADDVTLEDLGLDSEFPN